MNLVSKQRISIRKIILHNFQIKKLTKTFFILENSGLKLRLAKNKNKFRKLRTITQNQFNFRPANNISSKIEKYKILKFEFIENLTGRKFRLNNSFKTLFTVDLCHSFSCLNR